MKKNTGETEAMKSIEVGYGPDEGSATKKGLKYYTDKSRNAWNAVTDNHRSGEESEHLATLRAKDKTCLTEVDLRHFNDIGLSGKRIAHVACNKGNELLSLVQLGARPDSLGFDISDEAIKYARSLSRESGVLCQFERVDLYDIDEDTYGMQFDVVYISVGALGWLPQLRKAFSKTSSLLKPGGHFFVHEMHPILDMFKPDNECTTEETKQMTMEDSYFRTEPFVTKGGLDYVAGESYEACEEIWHHHKLSDIIQAALDNEFALISIEEIDKDLSKSYARLDNFANRPPRSYALLFVKK